MGWHYPRWLANGCTLVLHGFVVHESYVLYVLTNGVTLLTANHSSPLHSLSNPEERCRGRTASSFCLNQMFFFVSLSLVSLNVQFPKATLSLFCYFLPFFHSTDVPKNFTVKWATKTTVVLAWKFSESRSPYKCTVSEKKFYCQLNYNLMLKTF